MSMDQQVGRLQKLVVVGLCLLMIGGTLATLPWANLQFEKISAVVSFQSAIVVITDGLTAVLLLIQCSQLRQQTTLVLSGSYLFCAIIAFAQFMTFPDTLPINLAVPQSSPWLWSIWHFGFPLSILGYLVAVARLQNARLDHPVRAIILTVVGVTAAVIIITVGLIWGHDKLPVFFVAGDRFMSRLPWRTWLLVSNIVVIICAGIGLMRLQPRKSPLNLYLLLSLTAMACEVFCVTILESRYTLYWYFARLDGLISSSTVLVLFLIDNAQLYRKLASNNRTLESRVAERTAELSAALEDRERTLARQAVTEAALRESEERFRAAREASLDGFMIYEPAFDAAGRIEDLRIVYANPMAARYCESTPEAMIGRLIGEIMPGTRGSGGMIERHGSALINNRPLEYVLEYQTDGIHGHFLNMVVPFGCNLAATFRDITESVNQRSELQAAKAAAEQANAAKTRFLASISHDLRQPMMAQRLLLYTAESRAETQELANILARVSEALESAEDMLSRLMDFTALELGKVPVKRREFRLDVQLAAILDESSALADKKELHLKLWAFPCWTESDPVLLGRILRNLVVNAVHYTERGSVLVAVRRRGQYYRIEVRDSGQGIPPDQQALVFEEFRQLGNPERSRTKGQGLGLAIVSLTADLLGHRLSLRPRVDHGSVFAIEVPAVAEPADNGDKGYVKQEHPPLPMVIWPARILLVEDDMVQVNTMKTILTDCGHHVTVAESMVMAMALVSDRLDLIISDYRLPGGINGLDGIVKIRLACRRKVPALLLTGDTQAALVSEAAEAGCAILHKPCNPSDVLRLVTRLVHA
ncbi:MAG: ATP-binding protein [Rhodospirillaceae bacterium]